MENVSGETATKEIDRLAQRTRELEQANELLRREAEEQRLTIQTLRQPGLDLRRIVDSIPIPVAVTTPSGEVEALNKATLDYFGRTLEELKSWSASDAVHPDDLERTVAAQRAAHVAARSYDVESRHRRADGVYRWFNVLGLPLRDQEGRILCWFHLQIDIDDRKRAEDALAAGERNLQLMIETTPALFWTAEANGEADYFSQHYLDFVGAPAEQMRGWNWTAAVHPEDLPVLVSNWLAAMEASNDGQAEARLRGKDGEYRWFLFRARPLKDQQGKVVRWYGVNTDIEERKRAEEAVAASERNLQVIIDTVPSLAWSASPDGAAEFFNQHYLDYVGLPSGQLAGSGWTAAVHPDDLAQLGREWGEIMARGKPGEAEARIRKGDGSYRWFLFRANPLRNEQGDILKWYGVNIDIEDRKRAEEALQRSEHDLLQTIDALPALAWSALADGKAHFLNQHFLDFAGMPVSELRGWGWLKSIHPDDVETIKDAWAKAAERGASAEAEARMRRHDGQYRWLLFRTAPMHDEKGNIIKWYGVNTDIEDRKRVENSLRETTELLDEALRLTRTGSFITDINGEDHLWSDEARRIFGLGPEDKLARDDIRSRIHPDDLEPFEAAAARSADGASVTHDFRTLASGAIRHARISAHTVTRNGRTSYVGALQDLTDQKLAEAALDHARSELAHAARAMSLGVLTASIAHEINQPLAGIINNANTCLRLLGSDPPNVHAAQETARRTIRDGNRAADIVSRLRTLFSKKTGKSEKVNLNEAAEEVVALAARDLQRSRVTVRTDFARDLPLLNADRVQLQQVILNLLLNASDAMNGVEDRRRQMTIRTACEEHDVRLSVQDCGIGFADEDAERLFQAFYTTKSSGMGIGLSVSRSIIEGHNGRLWAERNPGPGATFSFSIPANPQEQRATA